MKEMKNILSVFMLLLAGMTVSATETTLWQGTYSDGIEINSETIATFKAGDILCIYLTVPEGGANFKICYKGAGNGWSETSIPSLNNQWPWVNGGQGSFEIPLTVGDISAITSQNIYIYKGDNSVITKVTLKSGNVDPEPDPEPDPDPVSNTFDENGVADLSKVEVQNADKVSYDVETHTVTTTEGWIGVQLTVESGEEVSGKELRVTFNREMTVKCYVQYTDQSGTDIIMDKPEQILYFTLDNSKNVYQVQLQPTEASAFILNEIVVNKESTKPVVTPLADGETRTIFKDEEGVKVSWNNFCEMNKEWGAILEAGEYFFVTVSARDPKQEWPKIVLRDASSTAVGPDIPLNDVSTFPYIAGFRLTEDMVEQLRGGFCFSGDGFTVTQVAIYKPEPGTGGEISLNGMSYTENAFYDAYTHNMTTTRRWGRAGWEITDDEYADKTLIIVGYKSVTFPVTLKIEYTTENGTLMGYSAGAAGGNTQVNLAIPKDIAMLRRVYITYPDGNSLELTDITLISAANARPLVGEPILPTAVHDLEGFEEDEADEWYTLGGMRVKQPGHGIYIRNGKKVYVK